MNELMTIDNDKVDLIKRTVAKGATDDQLELFLHQARKTGLDPLARQINCIMRWNKRENRNDMAIQVSIDGYRLIADRTGKYAGSDDPVFDNGLSMYEHIADGANLKPITASVTVYKIVSGIRCPFTATASWAAYAPSGNKAFMWNKMPHLMLGKCAEALALRKAFPAELSGVYTDDEMDQAGPVVAAGDYVEVDITAPESAGFKPADVLELDEELEPEAQPASNGASNESTIADIRAGIDGNGDTIQLGAINRFLADTGLYNDTTHAFNAVKKWDGWPKDGKYSADQINGGSQITREKALVIFDWAVERKAEKEAS